MAEKIIIRPPRDDKWKQQVSRVINKMVGNIPSDSTAVDVPTLQADFNALLAVLRGLNGN